MFGRLGYQSGTRGQGDGISTPGRPGTIRRAGGPCGKSQIFTVARAGIETAPSTNFAFFVCGRPRTRCGFADQLPVEPPPGSRELGMNLFRRQSEKEVIHVAIIKHNPDLSPTLPWSETLVNPPGMWPAIISAVCGTPPENHRHPECSLPGCQCGCHHPAANI